MKFFAGLVVFCMIAGMGYSQVVDPKQVAKDDATDRTNSNIEGGVDNGVGKAEGAIKGLFKKKKPATTQQTAQQPGHQMQATGGSGFRAYNNYDFVPGDSIVFEDHFTDDADGEFPAHWNLGKGQAVLNNMAGTKVFSLTDGNYAHVSPLIKSPSYLSDPFTIEFDNYSTGGYLPRIYFYASNSNAIAASSDLGSVNIGSGNIEYENHPGTIKLDAGYPADIIGTQYLNKWHHIAIAYKKGQIKVYVDQYRILVVPNIGFAPHAFDIEGIGDQNNPIMMANFRVANGGAMNMLGRKFTDAKIITHGINFDVDKATIKPESMGTLNMVAGVLRGNPDLKFEIDGHTDNTGTVGHNAMLSQQRADAVKAQLVSMGIDASRLSTKGFGDTKPVADNSTLEGKANNRRVEFVRQ